MAMADECVIMCDKCPGEATRRMQVMTNKHRLEWCDLCKQCVDGFDQYKATAQKVHARCRLCGGHGWTEMLKDERIGCEDCGSEAGRAHFLEESTHDMEGNVKRAKRVHGDGDDERESADDDDATTAKCSSDEDDADVDGDDDDGDNVSEIARAIVKTVNEEAAEAAAATDDDARRMGVVCEYLRSIKEGQEAIMSRLDTLVSILGERK